MMLLMLFMMKMLNVMKLLSILNVIILEILLKLSMKFLALNGKKSICIPRGKAVTVNDLCDFAGQEATFNTSISCIDDIEFEMLASFGITLKAKSEKKT